MADRLGPMAMTYLGMSLQHFRVDKLCLCSSCGMTCQVG